MSDSVRRRFLFTLAANLTRAALSFLTGLLLARWLGPAEYGNMAFLLGTFLGIRQLLDLGTSSAFFTFMSQQPRSRHFVRAFFAWLSAQFLIPLGILAFLFPAQWIDAIWHGENRTLVLLAFAAAFMQNSVWPVVQQAGEAQRQTIKVQGMGVAVAVVHLAAMGMFWAFGQVGLYVVFIVIALEYLIASISIYRMCLLPALGEAGSMDATYGAMVRSYWQYCLPMIPYAAAGFVYEFADRWLLQNYGGGVEQAYYAVGAQFAGLALIATTSILRIFWKEVAEASHRGDHARVRRLYWKTCRLMFLASAAITGLVLPWAGEMLRSVLGSAYAGGTTTLVIMFLYPVHQSIGQIGGTMLLATERVSLQVTTGMVFMGVSMVATYFLLAPRDASVPGLGLAAEGLAFKMVALQFVQVNVVAYFIARIWKWPFDWIYQPVSLIGCLGLGWAVKQLVTWSFVGVPNWLVGMGLAGVFYLILVGAMVYGIPSLAGMTRPELAADLTTAWQRTRAYYRR